MEQELTSTIVDEVLLIFEQTFWAFIWTTTAICLLALAFAAAERLAFRYRSGGNGPAMIPQMEAGRTLGLWMMVLGIGGLIVCVAAWTALFGDAGRWLTLLFKRMQEAGGGNEVTILVLSILSMLVFDFGVYKYLASEKSAPKTDL